MKPNIVFDTESLLCKTFSLHHFVTINLNDRCFKHFVDSEFFCLIYCIVFSCFRYPFRNNSCLINLFWNKTVYFTTCLWSNRICVCVVCNECNFLVSWEYILTPVKSFWGVAVRPVTILWRLKLQWDFYNEHFCNYRMNIYNFLYLESYSFSRITLDFLKCVIVLKIEN